MKWQPLKKPALINRNFPSLWLALSFYTRLPCPKNLDYSQLPRPAIYLPLIGYLVGGMCAVVFYFAQFFWSQTISILLAVIAGILVTGAFHEDGFADVCDGFGGGYEKERILQIMKDSAIGVYGALGLGLLIALKIITLVSLPLEKLPIIFISAHSLSRLAPLCLMRFYDYARLENSKVQNAIFQPTYSELCFALICATLPLFFLPAILGFSLFSVGVATLFLGRYFQQKIGGYTGDCLGCVQQITETIFYLSVSALWKFI